MLSLRPVPFLAVQRFFADFQKKAKSYDMPAETAEYFGTYEDDRMIGYMAVSGYDHEVVEVTHGYLLPEGRHKGYATRFMDLLEDMARKAGYKRVEIATGRSFKAYHKFASSMGYKPSTIVFAKEL